MKGIGDEHTWLREHLHGILAAKLKGVDQKEWGNTIDATLKELGIDPNNVQDKDFDDKVFKKVLEGHQNFGEYGWKISSISAASTAYASVLMDAADKKFVDGKDAPEKYRPAYYAYKDKVEGILNSPEYKAATAKAVAEVEKYIAIDEVVKDGTV